MSSSNASSLGEPLSKQRRTKAKSKTARKSWGKGKRLGDGESVEDAASTPLSVNSEEDPKVAPRWVREVLAAKEKRRVERKKHEEIMKPIRKAEAALKKKLGRKLTNGEKNFIRLSHHHEELVNVWGDLQETVVPIKPVTMEAHPSLKIKLLPFQKESLYWMKEQEKGPWAGGMLADEMGMGKTIQTIALLLSEPRQKPSLVVAPVVALMQWKHEIEDNTDNFTVCVWHGQGRMKAAELKKYDVVLSSYGTLEASFRRQQRGFKRGNLMIKEKSPLHTFQWHRVILDEAHNIKERSTNAAKAAFALDAKYRWCLSGTPLQNRVGELYSLVRFLGADPFSHYFCKKCDCKSLHWQFKDKRHCDECGHKPMEHVCFWNTEILTPIARYGIEPGNPGHEAFKKLKILLDRMMLRRTKLERADDLGLPPRTIVVRRDYFSPEERELYMSLFTGAKRQFATYVDQGTVLNNYSNIFSLITRMRQMACHPDLVLKSKTSKLAQDVSEGVVCRICSDQAEDAIVSACKHVFDRECIKQYLEVQQLRGHKPECPVCHIEISIDLEAEAIDLTEGQGAKARQGILSRLNLDNWRSSTKLEALVEELQKLREQDSTIKSLVFSQFVSFLDLCAFRLQRAGFTICRLEGGMTPQQRDATIQHFMKNTNVSVFLISLKAGGVALNLTEASMVFMMDSWWNPSVEYQAMDRIHRLGQHRPVKVVKLVVQDSIEDQIVQLQSKKLAMTEAALSRDPDAALGKLTVEDLGFLFKM
ncbi:SNF2 family N-terminal domain-domain-containing protein [Kockovaella imperatae]|uniref:SNF2 family N-terminal domain-domain-containing protein n=1 Tax=Kockovaella imperatae TaxID=4999 RepID=A0A1Y1UIW4_9TREE|nr:SNF2 family N-terminal domain-domain-containing protein [Kockovaella imperatae]ORX37998.1 SNF2 family N-terminal domain-domain-containing protein [Kockovaella imperatae]